MQSTVPGSSSNLIPSDGDGDEDEDRQNVWDFKLLAEL